MLIRVSNFQDLINRLDYVFTNITNEIQMYTKNIGTIRRRGKTEHVTIATEDYKYQEESVCMCLPMKLQEKNCTTEKKL